MLSVSLCGTFNRVAVHENKTKTFYCHFCNVSTHSEHAPCKATVSENLIHPLAHAAFCVSVWQGNGLRMLIGRTFQNRQHSEKVFLGLFVHGNVQLTWVSDTHAWSLPLVSDTHACTHPLVSDTQTCVVRSPPNISSKTCDRGLWQRYDRKAGDSLVARWRRNILRKKI